MAVSYKRLFKLFIDRDLKKRIMPHGENKPSNACKDGKWR